MKLQLHADSQAIVQNPLRQLFRVLLPEGRREQYFVCPLDKVPFEHSGFGPDIVLLITDHKFDLILPGKDAQIILIVPVGLTGTGGFEIKHNTNAGVDLGN